MSSDVAADLVRELRAQAAELRRRRSAVNLELVAVNTALRAAEKELARATRAAPRKPHGRPLLTAASPLAQEFLAVADAAGVATYVDFATKIYGADTVVTRRKVANAVNRLLRAGLLAQLAPGRWRRAPSARPAVDA